MGGQYLDAFASIDKGVGTALALVPQQGGDDAAHALTPTEQVYGALQSGFTFFNASLFANKLPDCLITLQRDWGAYGYFCASRIVAAGDVARIADEIALNPVHFAVRTAMETFSTLVHEMVHCAQQHFGAPSPHGYHNLEFAGLMRGVGLEPSDTGKPGGQTDRPPGLPFRHCRRPVRSCLSGLRGVGPDDRVGRRSGAGPGRRVTGHSAAEEEAAGLRLSAMRPADGPGYPENSDQVW